ncbi:MAG: ABC transporter substrate-binding protein [Rhodospirillaceae bacterium]|nr:ABC transporter substrate-binding protein [Rhodospirillaceae bacterium]
MRVAVTLGAALAAMIVSHAAADELRIGFLNTTSGGGAIIGRHLERGWKLGLAHEGWNKDGDKLGGVPTRIFYADDQAKTDVAVKEAEKFIKQDKVQIVSGVIWSNVLMAVQKPVLDAGLIMLSANAGATPMAGALCNPRFIASSFVNDQVAEAMGILATRDKLKSVFAMAPNYQAGKEVVAGFERTYSGGKIADRSLFKFGESDFQADISKIRAAKSEAVFIFAPGAMGIAFMKQWVAAGLDKQVKLYAMWTISHVTLPAIGDAALGAVMADHWNVELDNPRNKRFIKDHIARYGEHPSHFTVTAYDAVAPLARGLEAVKGKLDDLAALARAIRKGPFQSVRGDLKFNVNGFPIQPFWKMQVVKGADGKPAFKAIEKIIEQPDTYAAKCPANMRI